MKIIFRLILMIAILSTSACNKKIVLINKTPSDKSTAPGQLKKQTGSQSAKPFAPGQRKKN